MRLATKVADRDRRVLIVAGLLVWELVMRLGLVSPLFAASPSSIAISLGELLMMEEVRRALRETLTAMVTSFTIAAVAGIVLAVAIGRSKFLYRAFHPISVMIYSSPKMIFLPLLILFLGIGPALKVAYGAFSAFFAVLIMVTAGVRVVDKKLHVAARSMGATRWQEMRHVDVPAAMPSVVVGLWYGLKHAVTAVLIAELFVGGGRGIGYFIDIYTATFQASRVWALVIALSLVAILLGNFWRWVEERVDKARIQEERLAGA